jgi:hypothetical protein
LHSCKLLLPDSVHQNPLFAILHVVQNSQVTIWEDISQLLSTPMLLKSWSSGQYFN